MRMLLLSLHVGRRRGAVWCCASPERRATTERRTARNACRLFDPSARRIRCRTVTIEADWIGIWGEEGVRISCILVCVSSTSRSRVIKNHDNTALVSS
eukprot:SAG11_NODE_3320_length_2525_cov_2.455070_5_plen_98_part_00